jgi:acetyl-CoA C-acetyltransferase
LANSGQLFFLASSSEAKRTVDEPSVSELELDYVAGEGLLMAPTVAVSELLKRNGLKLQDFDFYEIHEAFAGQVLCTMKAWESAELSAVSLLKLRRS